MRVLYVQFAGDFVESFNRLIIRGEEENYYGQKYTVETVWKQSNEGHTVKIVVLQNPQDANVELKENLSYQTFAEGSPTLEYTIKAIEDFKPDRVIVRSPQRKLLKYLRKNGIPTLPLFADSFDKSGSIRHKFNRNQLARELRQDFFKWIGNHQINACRSLARLGIRTDKLLPYDWEHPQSPEDWPRSDVPRRSDGPIRLFYAGAMSEDKGVHELVSAVRALNESGIATELKLAGRGDFSKVCAALDMPETVDYVSPLGLISHDDVLENMARADFVAVPSQHVYPEGLPMTIMESLMVGTPVIASDHPMFVGRVGKRGSVRFFREKNVDELKALILEISSDENTYQSARDNTSAEWYDLLLDLKWADLVNKWIDDPRRDDFKEYSLAAIQP